MNTMHYHKHDSAPLSLYNRSTNTQSSIVDHKNSGPKISSKRRFNAHPVLRQGLCMRKGGVGVHLILNWTRGGKVACRRESTSTRPMRSPAPDDVCSPKDRNYGELWGIMGNYGELWGIMGFYGELWGNFGELWGIMGNYGELWGIMGFHGELWGNLGVIWGNMGNCEELWGSMGLSGELWGCMGLYGVVWGIFMMRVQHKSGRHSFTWPHVTHPPSRRPPAPARPISVLLTHLMSSFFITLAR